MPLLRRCLLAALVLSGCTFHVEGLRLDASASTDDLGGDLGAADLGPGVPATLAFVTAPQTVTAGQCSGIITVEVHDVFGDPAEVGADTPVALAAAPAMGVRFYADASCTTEVTQVSVPAGEHAAGFYARGTLAGEVVISASAVGLGGATQTLTLTVGAPGALAFTSGAQTLDAGACSSALTVETRDLFGNPSPVGAPTALSLDALPSGGFAFYADAACTAVVTGVTLSIGASASTVYFKGTFPGAVTLTASATGLTAATQIETLQAGPAAVLSISTPPRPLTTNSCSTALTIQARDAAGNPSQAAVVSLGATPPTGVTFFSDANCTIPVTSATTSGGAVTVYFRRNAIGSFTFNASSTGTTGATQNETIAADAVQTGTCTIDDGQPGSATGNSHCTIAPALIDISKTFMIFQATAAGASIPSNHEVRCALTNTTTITCDRGGTAGAISIRWYTVFVPTGLRVQHRAHTCVTASDDVTVDPPVDPAHTFLLSSGLAVGTTISGDDLFTAKLISPTVARIQFSNAGCATGAAEELQVVEYDAANVTRGTLPEGVPDSGISLAMNLGSGSFAGAAAVDLSRTFLLYSYRTAYGVADKLCNRMLRGSMPTSTSIAFSRGDGDSTNCYGADIDEIAWERVELPGGSLVQAVAPSLADAADTATAAISGVDTTRALAFAGGQWSDGQSIGEGTDPAQQMGAMTGLHRLASATSLEVKRGQASGAALWTSFVVQLR